VLQSGDSQIVFHEKFPIFCAPEVDLEVMFNIGAIIWGLCCGQITMLQCTIKSAALVSAEGSTPQC